MIRFLGFCIVIGFVVGLGVSLTVFSLEGKSTALRLSSGQVHSGQGERLTPRPEADRPLDGTPKPSPTPIPDPYLGESGQTTQVRIPILFYHYIGNNPIPEDTARDTLSVTPDRFKEHMEYLSQEGYTTLTFDMVNDILKGSQSLPAKPVVLTFDDGYIDFYYNAYPILEQFSFKATVFVPTGLVGGGAYLTWEMIGQMAGTGIEFQSHTVNHAYLPSLSRTRMVEEVTESKKTLEERLGHPVNWFAYPYGAISGSSAKAVKEAGYAGAVGTIPGVNQSAGQMFNLRRQRIGANMDLETFKTKL
ncbi:MAG: polysaccharide deacetylase family protein [bacterium]|nr:polysaccharide deacetylase family protein [bacterium]